VNRIVVFTDPYCGPCGMVKKYFAHMKDERAKDIEIVSLYDDLEYARKYGVTRTPVLIVINEKGGMIDKVVGGQPITQNIRRILEEYHGKN